MIKRESLVDFEENKISVPDEGGSGLDNNGYKSYAQRLSAIHHAVLRPAQASNRGKRRDVGIILIKANEVRAGLIAFIQLSSQLIVTRCCAVCH